MAITDKTVFKINGSPSPDEVRLALAPELMAAGVPVTSPEGSETVVEAGRLITHLSQGRIWKFGEFRTLLSINLDAVNRGEPRPTEPPDRAEADWRHLDHWGERFFHGRRFTFRRLVEAMVKVELLTAEG
jgi:hypothetical protein